MSYRYLIIILFIYLFAGCRNSEVGLPQDCFEMGKAYEELQLLDSASFYYRKAIDLSDANGDNELKGMICNRLGNLFLQADLYEKAADVFDEALKCNVELKDKTSLSKSLRGKGKSLLFRNESDSAINYFMQAYGLIHQIEDTNEVLQINNNLSSVYYVLKQYEKAFVFNKRALSLSKDSIDIYRNWFAKGDILVELQQYDSAWYYYEQASYSSSIYTKAGCYFAMSKLKQRLQLPDSSKYLKIYSIIKDSIEHLDQRNSIYSANIQYLENQNFAEKRMILYICCIIFIFVCILLVLFLVKRYKYELKIEKAKLKDELSSKENIERSKKCEKIEEIQRDLINNIKEAAENSIKDFVMEDKFQEIKCKLKQAPLSLTNKEKKYMFDIVMKIFTPFIQSLSMFLNISKEDCYLCCLSLLKFTTKEISYLKGSTWDATRAQKSRIKKKNIEVLHSLDLFEFIFRKKAKMTK